MTKAIVTHHERCLGCGTCVIECAMAHTNAETLVEAIYCRDAAPVANPRGTTGRLRHADAVSPLRGSSLYRGLSHRRDPSFLG